MTPYIMQETSLVVVSKIVANLVRQYFSLQSLVYIGLGSIKKIKKYTQIEILLFYFLIV